MKRLRQAKCDENHCGNCQYEKKLFRLFIVLMTLMMSGRKIPFFFHSGLIASPNDKVIGLRGAYVAFLKCDSYLTYGGSLIV